MKQAKQKTTSLNDILVAIRKKCLDCCGNQSKYVKACRSKDCPLYPFRCVEELEKLAIKA